MFKFRQSRVLIIGCGDIGQCFVNQWRQRTKVLAMTSTSQRRNDLRQMGVIPLQANLDQPDTLRRLASVANRILYLVPPAQTGQEDQRMRAFLSALALRGLQRYTPVRTTNLFKRLKTRNVIVHERSHNRKFLQVLYLSTTGVYGDCRGEWVNEWRTPAPSTMRAKRRLSAETMLRKSARQSAFHLNIIRVPGIYSLTRLPWARLQAGLPVLRPEEDVFTNHIHADDLAAILLRVLQRGLPNQIIHAVDHTQLKMGAYYRLLASTFGFALPETLSLAEMARQVSALRLSFMQESRRLSNDRLVKKMGYRFRFPSIDDFLYQEATTCQAWIKAHFIASKKQT